MAMSSEKIVYDGFVKVKTYRYNKKTYEKVDLNSAVSALVVNEDGKMLLVMQYRPCIEGLTYEIPAGIIDKQLPDDKIMIEELKEECNIPEFDIKDIREVAKYFINVGNSDSTMTIYKILVTSKSTDTMIEGDEVTKAEWKSKKEVESMSFVDPKTIIAKTIFLGE